MTHGDLINRAVHWLRNSRGCSVVITQAALVCFEQPDAIGWTAHGRSILLECKASRADFHRDRHKWHRLTSGMGSERYYLTPPAMVKPEEVYEGWGLMECLPHCLRKRKDCPPRPDKRHDEEIRHLLAFIHRCGRPVLAEWELVDGCLPDIGL